MISVIDVTAIAPPFSIMYDGTGGDAIYGTVSGRPSVKGRAFHEVDYVNIPIGANFDLHYQASRASTGEPINHATVSFELKDANSTVRSAGFLTYVAGTFGKYLGMIHKEDTGLLFHQESLTLEITASAGEIHDFRRIGCTAVYRTLT